MKYQNSFHSLTMVKKQHYNGISNNVPSNSGFTAEFSQILSYSPTTQSNEADMGSNKPTDNNHTINKSLYHGCTPCRKQFGNR